MKVHLSKGNRNFAKGTFRALCEPKKKIKEDKDTECTYSLSNVTCKACLEALLKEREREISLIKELITFCEQDYRIPGIGVTEAANNLLEGVRKMGFNVSDSFK